MSKQAGQKKRKEAEAGTAFGTTSKIKRFIDDIVRSGGRPFYTRECLDMGRREAVDVCLHRLVKNGTLERQANGCFIVAGSKQPTKNEIAEGKAKAFGRQLYVHGVNALKTFFNFTNEETENCYATDGASSRFQTTHYGTVELKQYAPRKLTLGDSVVGLIIRALWHYKCRVFASHLWELLKQRIGRRERDALKKTAHLIPEWLVNIVVYRDQYVGPVLLKQDLLLRGLSPRIRKQDIGTFEVVH